MTAGNDRPPLTEAQALAMTDARLRSKMAELIKSRRNIDRYDYLVLRSEAIRRGIAVRGSKHVRGSGRQAKLRQDRRDDITRGAELAAEQQEQYRKEVAGRERGKVADIGVTDASPIIRGETYAAHKESTWRVKKRPLG